MTDSTDPARPPMIFLCGPPGAGKSCLGSRVCQDLGLEFLDLSHPTPSAGDPVAGMKELQASIAERSAEVVALSWVLSQSSKVLSLARRCGELVLLWAHPLDMQERSEHEQILFTPGSRVKTRNGFGRNGTGCLEFRRLDRACPSSLLLVGVSLDEATQMLKDAIVWLRKAAARSPTEREGLTHWANGLREDYNADPEAAQVLVDAMARYLRHLREEGTSPRILSGVYQDLDAAAILLFMYEPPASKDVLRSIACSPSEFSFEQRFSDSPNLVARFRRNLEKFAGFLEQSGLIPENDSR